MQEQKNLHIQVVNKSDHNLSFKKVFSFLKLFIKNSFNTNQLTKQNMK